MKFIKQIYSLLILCTIFTISETKVYADTLVNDDLISVDTKHENFNYNLKPASINEKVSAEPVAAAKPRGNVVNVNGGNRVDIIGGEGVNISDNTVNVTGKVTLSGNIYSANNKTESAPTHATITGNNLNITNANLNFTGTSLDIAGVSFRSTATVTGNNTVIDGLTINTGANIAGIVGANNLSEMSFIENNKFTLSNVSFNADQNVSGIFITTLQDGKGVTVRGNSVTVNNSVLEKFIGYKLTATKEVDGATTYTSPTVSIFENNSLFLNGVNLTTNATLIDGVITSLGNTIKLTASSDKGSVNGHFIGLKIANNSNSVEAGKEFISSHNDTISLDGIKILGTQRRFTALDLSGIYSVNGLNISLNNFTIDGRPVREAVRGVFANAYGSGSSVENEVLNSNMYISGNTDIKQNVTFIDLTSPLGVTVSNNNLVIGYNKDNGSHTGTITIGNSVVGVSLSAGGSENPAIENAVIDNNKVYAGGESVTIKGDVKTITEQGNDNVRVTNNMLYLGMTPKNTNANVNITGSAYAVESGTLGTFQNNGVLISGKTAVTGSVYGVSSTGDKSTLNGNFVNVNGATNSIGYKLYGVLSTGAGSTITGNKVIIDGAKSAVTLNEGADLYGASSEGAESTLTNNIVSLDGTKNSITANGTNIYGASTTQKGILTGNAVQILGQVNVTNTNQNIYGASSTGAESTLTNNIVSLDGTKKAVTVNGANIYGASTTQKGILTGNTVQLLGQVNVTNTTQNIYGAFGDYGKVEDNKVVLNSNGKQMTVTSNIYGAYINGGVADASTIQKNEVTVLGNVNLTGNVFGAYNNIDGGALSNNQIIIGNKINATSITGNSASNIYSAYADKNGTTLSNNFIGINDNVNINNNNLNIYGAYAKGESAKLSANRIIVGEVEMYTGPTKEQTTRIINPTVNITSQGIYGAYAENASSSLTANEVIIASKTDINSSIYGAYAGASATGSTLSENRVVIVNDAKVTGSIYGAYAENGNVSLNGVSLGALAIDKGTINLTGDVYGGYSKNGTATENVVKLNGRNDFQNIAIYGGYSANNQDQVTGNVLLLNKFRGSVGSLNNFEQIEFQRDDKGFSSANVWKENDVVINIKGGKTENLNGTKFKNVPNLIADAKDKVYKDARMYLMYNEKGGLGKLNLGSHQGRLRHGYLRYYDYHLKGDDQSVQIILGKDDGGPVEKPNLDQNKPDTDNRVEAESSGVPLEAESFLGGRDALAIMVKRGGDMVAAINSNIIHPLEATESEKKYKIGTFLTTGGGYVQDEGKTTEITVSRGAILTGIGANFNQPIADIFLTTFFEGGYGTYTRTGSYDVLGEQVNVTADGKSDYYGGGFTLRSDFKVKPAHIVYIDSSFRGGETNYSYKAKNYVDKNNINAEYKSATAYYGAHVGTGYMYNLNDKYIFDVYAKYLFSYYDDDQVSLSDVEKIDFGSFSSHRINSGLRVSFTTPVGITPYIGAGFEYQADEGVNAMAFGKAITGHESTLDVMGTFEAGFTYGKQFEKLRLSLDVKGKGSAGALNSGAGSFDIRLDF